MEKKTTSNWTAEETNLFCSAPFSGKEFERKKSKWLFFSSTISGSHWNKTLKFVFRITQKYMWMWNWSLQLPRVDAYKFPINEGSSHRKRSVKKDVLRNFAKLTGKHLFLQNISGNDLFKSIIQEFYSNFYLQKQPPEVLCKKRCSCKFLLY